MRIHFAALIALTLLLPCSLYAQNPGGGIGVPIGPDFVNIVIDDFDATIGGTVVVPVKVEADYSMTGAIISFDETKLELLSINPSDGTNQYIDDNGTPIGCDIILPTDTGLPEIHISMFLFPPYEIATYGEDIFILEFSVLETEKTTSELTVFSFMDGTDTTVIATFVEDTEAKFVRGDTNGDQSCNLADVPKLLGYLFSGDTLSCRDSADIDDNGGIDMSDAISMLNNLFNNSNPVVDECLSDQTEDSMVDCIGSC